MEPEELFSGSHLDSPDFIVDACMDIELKLKEISPTVIHIVTKLKQMNFTKQDILISQSAIKLLFTFSKCS